jgi:hypothetical protein
MANKNRWFRRAGKGNRQTGHSPTRGSGANPGFRGRLQPLFVEELEPRLAPSADLVYAEGTPPNTFDPTAIAGYAAGLISTNLRAR